MPLNPQDIVRKEFREALRGYNQADVDLFLDEVVEEDAAGRFLYRTFGTAFPGDKTLRNVMLQPPVNVSVYPYAGKLLAFGEQSLVKIAQMGIETGGHQGGHKEGAAQMGAYVAKPWQWIFGWGATIVMAAAVVAMLALGG